MTVLYGSLYRVWGLLFRRRAITGVIVFFCVSEKVRREFYP